MDVARGQLQGDDLMAVVEDEVQLEAEEPAHRGLAALGQTGEDLVPANAMKWVCTSHILWLGVVCGHG
jgi:hypothetical protein